MGAGAVLGVKAATGQLLENARKSFFKKSMIGKGLKRAGKYVKSVVYAED